MKLPLFIERYVTHLQLKGRQPSTIRRYLYDINDFYDWIVLHRNNNNIDWKTISQEEIKQFFHELKAKRKYSIRTMRRIHSVLSQLARYQKSLGSNELQPIFHITAPTLTDEMLCNREWITKFEKNTLLKSMASTSGLTDNQLKTFHFYKNRNIFIVQLLLTYGLTLQEVQQLSMLHIKFERNEVIVENSSQSRTIHLCESDKQLAYKYYVTIPKPVRPRYYSDEPLFVSFDFKRKTFHWSYDEDMPKRISIVSIQKMIRNEVKRAQLRKGISAQTFRNTFILKQLIQNRPKDELNYILGYTSPLSLKRYENTVSLMSKNDRRQLTQSDDE